MGNCCCELLDIWKEILTDSRISEMLGISADDAIDAGVPNTGFTLWLVVGRRQVPVAYSL